MVYLSERSYTYELSRVHSISSRVSVLPNGVNTEKFLSLDAKNKEFLKSEFDFQNKLIFMWCANDRPKKGLHIILEAWKNSSLYNNINCELIIVGSTKLGVDYNIHYFGQIPHTDLPRFYQVSDYYLFTTLCQEGFPLSLAEAIASGLKCLVSSIDPLPSIFSKFGNVKFVKSPNMIKSWVNVLNAAYQNRLDFDEVSNGIVENEFSMDKWSYRLNEIILQN
jgi:glycosyltransferase involved in cell wall biosynthesis